MTQQGEGLRTRLLAPFRAHPRASLYLLSLLLHLAIAPFVIHDWDGYVFVEVTREFLQGTTPYAAVEAERPHIYVGDAVPIVNSWYAYPPVALLLMAPGFWLVTLFSTAPWAERLAIKLPFILGDLLLAFVTAALVREVLKDDAEKAARRAAWVEKALLFNPFLLFISAAWGMFDAWIVLFLVASVLLVLRNRPGWAGVCFALACLVKPFPVVLGPLFLGFVGTRLGWRRAAPLFVGAGAVAGLLLCLPFLLDAPRGFLQMTLLNHAQRPPQGFTLIGIPLAFGWINDLTGLALPTAIRPEALSRVSFLLLGTLALLVSTRMFDLRDPRRLLALALCMMVGTLLVSKVVNEQYFVLPVALGALAYAIGDRPLHRRVFLAYTAGGVVSALILGWHFITFLPVDVATALLPVHPLEAVPTIRAALGWDDAEAFVYTTLIAALALVPACLLSVRLVLGEAGSAARDLVARRREVPRAGWLAIGMAALLLVAPLGSSILAARTDEDLGAAPALQKEGPLVAMLYTPSWHNPAHDPRVEWGNWLAGHTQTPEAGYYTASAGKMRSDFRLMREHGVDLVVVSHREWEWPKLPAIARAAEEAGVLFALQVELAPLDNQPHHQPRDAHGTPLGPDAGRALRNGTADAIAAILARALDVAGASPAWWRAEGRPVLLLADADEGMPDADDEGRARMLALAHDLARRRPDLAPPDATPDAIDAAYPMPVETSGAGPYAGLWRAALDEADRLFWTRVRERVEDRHGAVHLIGGHAWDPDVTGARGLAPATGSLRAFDSSYVPHPADAWDGAADAAIGHARWLERHVLLAQHARGVGAPVLVTLTPSHDDGDGLRIHADALDGGAYRRAWLDALDLHPDVILVASWNEFNKGNAVEPTLEQGRRFLDETTRFANLLHARRDSTPTPAPGDAPGVSLGNALGGAPGGAQGEAPGGPTRVLLVTNLRGATFEPIVAEPDWTWSLSLQLQRKAHTLWGPHADAIEWNGATPRVDLTHYDLIIVEPGAGRAIDPHADDFAQRILDHARQGGHVLLLGSQVSGAWARLAPWTEGDVLTDAQLLLPDGTARPLEPSDRTRIHHLPADGDAYLWMENETVRAPAAWTFPRGNGIIMVTAFKPQAQPTVDALRAVISQA